MKHVHIALAAAAWLVAPSAFAVHYLDDPDADPDVKEWYQRVVRSDLDQGKSPCRIIPLDLDACLRSKPAGKTSRSSGASCCGEADAYWADEYRLRDSKFYAVVTDTRDVPGRTSIPVGTEIEVPAASLDIYRQGNPTGHAILFLATNNYPLCYFFNTGG